MRFLQAKLLVYEKINITSIAVHMQNELALSISLQTFPQYIDMEDQTLIQICNANKDEYCMGIILEDIMNKDEAPFLNLQTIQILLANTQSKSAQILNKHQLIVPTLEPQAKKLLRQSGIINKKFIFNSSKNVTADIVNEAVSFETSRKGKAIIIERLNY